MNDVSQAVSVLRAGGLVAFPTETVYGLGADATSTSAVQKIFIVKGRPATNPLIVHVASETVARCYAAEWPEAASRLIHRFWPGPLTLVLPKRPSIVAEATAGLDTVGLRCPDHPLAIELLRAFDGPVAAPSANRSTRVSPTTAQHVREELDDAVDYILDGGPCRVGIESTVLDLCGQTPTILRPGAVTAAMIEREIGPVRVFHGSVNESVPAVSPGQQFRHYAPAATAYRFERDQIADAISWFHQHASESWAVVTIGKREEGLPGDNLIEMPENAADYAQRLYGMLRELDGRGVRTIWIEMPPQTPQWAAVRDRLTRATNPIPPQNR